MHLLIDDDNAARNSRLTAIRLAILTARSVELWRRDVHDVQNAMIIVAVIAITSEKLLRADLPPEQRALENYLPLDELQRCNVASIAAATGLNRETARRRVEGLIKAGSLIKTAGGEIALPPERVQEPAALALVRKQLEAVTRFVNDALRDGIFELRS
ncbi:MAG: hypothetical protein QOI38_2913 [Sphingomonadales bacterium]|jgi:hypothetical protein|nr:hypothetical protein [Sphingomonadales bacterium]